MFRVRSFVALSLVAGEVFALAQQMHYNVGQHATPEEIPSAIFLSCRMARDCHRDMARRHKAVLCSRQNVQAVTECVARHHRFSSPRQRTWKSG
jgi:hypothetical protein